MLGLKKTDFKVWHLKTVPPPRPTRCLTLQKREKTNIRGCKATSNKPTASHLHIYIMASVTLLPAALQNSLQEIVDQSNQAAAEIRAILLSTTEGVPLGRVYASSSSRGDQQQQQQQQQPPLNEEVLASIESVWAPASKQFPVLGLEKVHCVTAMYDHGTLMHVYQTPLVVTILCGPSSQCSNLGAIRSTTIPLLKQALEPLCTTLVESLKPDYESSATAYYQ